MYWRFCALLALLISASCSEQVVVRETRAQCGNGQVEVDEDCDDGNDISGDACTTDVRSLDAAMEPQGLTLL